MACVLGSLRNSYTQPVNFTARLVTLMFTLNLWFCRLLTVDVRTYGLWAVPSRLGHANEPQVKDFWWCTTPWRAPLISSVTLNISLEYPRLAIRGHHQSGDIFSLRVHSQILIWLFIEGGGVNYARHHASVCEEIEYGRGLQFKIFLCALSRALLVDRQAATTNRCWKVDCSQ